MGQLSKKDMKSILQQGNLAGLGLRSYALDAYRCEQCGAVEFFSTEI